MSVSGSCRDELDQSLRGDDALDTGEIVAEFAVSRDADGLALEGFFGAAEEFALSVVGEVDGFEFVIAQPAGEVFGDGAADAGGVDGDVAGAADAVGKDGFLFGERNVFEDLDLACPEDAGDALKRPGDGEIFSAADVDPDEERVGRAGLPGAERRGGIFDGADQVHREDLGGVFHELALELLRPAIGIGEIGFELLDVEVEALVDGVVNTGLVAFEIGSTVPQFVELVVHARGRGDDAQLQASAQGVGDDGIDSAPDFLGVFMEGELVED